MSEVVVIRGSLQEGVDCTSVAYATRPDQIAFVQADITSWELRVFSTVSPKTSLYTLTGQAASAAFFNSLQTDGFWGGLSGGYNFRHTVAATNFSPEGGVVYTLEYKLNTASFGVSWIIAHVAYQPTATG